MYVTNDIFLIQIPGHFSYYENQRGNLLLCDNKILIREDKKTIVQYKEKK